MVKEEERENHDESARLAMEVVKEKKEGKEEKEGKEKEVLAMEVVKEEKEGKEKKEERVLSNLICFVAQARAAIAEAFSSLKITTFLMTYGSHCDRLDHTWPI